MTETKTITISTLIAIGIVLAGMVTPSFFDGPKYYCESRPQLGVVSCDDFSKYVADNGKCIRNDNTNLICREGWLEVTNDLDLPEEEEENNINNINGALKYKCNVKGCTEI